MRSIRERSSVRTPSLFCYSFARPAAGAPGGRSTARGARRGRGAGRRPWPHCSLAAARGADRAAHVQVGGLGLGLRLGFVGGLGEGHGLTRRLLALL